MLVLVLLVLADWLPAWEENYMDAQRSEVIAVALHARVPMAFGFDHDEYTKHCSELELRATVDP